jgi:antirestriction protein ArdC
MSRARTETRPDLYSRVTTQILEQLEQGVRPWTRPWSAEHLAGRISRPLRHTGQPYSGINVILLWAQAVASGYSTPTWMTFRQAIELGGCVRKGEHGTTVVYANRMTRTETDGDGHDVEREIPFLKAYVAFNVEQIEGLPEQYYARPLAPSEPQGRVAVAEHFFAAPHADIRQGGDRAYYAVGEDYVRTPPFETFCDPESYYATLAHECTHWTLHPTRLDRDFGRKRWGDEGYAREELVAELGAAFLCADLGLELEPREDHAAYLESWLQVLSADKRFIFTAAAHAQRACDFLHDLQPATEPWAA